MKKIGVIGAGVMGVGVAHSLAKSGFQVILIDISGDILENSKNEIYKNIRFQTFFNKGKDVESADTIISRIVFSSDYQLLNDVDVVIENVTEKWEVKKEVYERIDSICNEQKDVSADTSQR